MNGPVTDEPPDTQGHAEQRRFEADRLTKLLLFLSFISLVVVTGLAVLIQQNSKHSDDVSAAVTEMQTSVDRVESFVDELETETPQEAAQSAAITEAVELVPELRVILCQAFPNVSACQTG